MYDPTTSTLTVAWEHAEGPVQQYRISYAPTTGDPIEEHVSSPSFLLTPPSPPHPPPPPLFFLPLKPRATVPVGPCKKKYIYI